MRRSVAAVPPRGKPKMTKPRPAARVPGSAASAFVAKKLPWKRREAASLSVQSDGVVPSPEDTFVDPEDKENARGDNNDVFLECARLREQLERVLVDRARQEEEVVALRALAKSLKEEVEAIQRHSRTHQTSELPLRDATKPSTCPTVFLGPPREFFKLDEQLEELRAENTALRERLEATARKHSRLRAFVDRELREQRLAAVKATAELQSAASQLVEEQAECDRLRAQVARFQARGDDPVRVSGLAGTPDRGRKQLMRAREELLLQCLAEEGEPRRWRRAGDSERAVGRQSRTEEHGRGPTEAEGGPTEADAGMEQLGDDVAALETQLRGLHASLELTRSMAGSDS